MSTSQYHNQAHARKGKSLAEFNAKKNFQFCRKKLKFTFYCQNQFLEAALL